MAQWGQRMSSHRQARGGHERGFDGRPGSAAARAVLRGLMRRTLASFLVVSVVVVGAGAAGCDPDAGPRPDWEEQYRARSIVRSETRDEDTFSARADTSSFGRFTNWQDDARLQLERVLGVVRRTPEELALDVRNLESVSFDGYRRDTIDYVLDRHQRAPAYLYIPDGAGPFAAVLVWHGHGGCGKDGPAGIPPCDDDYMHDAARKLAEQGYVVLAPDVRSFGITGNADDHVAYTKMQALRGGTAVGTYFSDAMRALDVLEAQDVVDATRMGVAGVSLGGQISLYLAALDTRVAVSVSHGYFGTLRGTFLAKQHCVCQYPSGLGSLMDLEDVAMLAAPTPIMFTSGERDTLFPAGDVQRAVLHARVGYEVMGAADEIVFVLHPGAHEWTMPETQAFLDEHLL